MVDSAKYTIEWMGAKAEIIGKEGKTTITIPTTYAAEIMDILTVHGRTSYRERKLGEALEALDEKYGIGKLYYPGSGWHTTPKEALGEGKIVHLSLEENASFVDGGYFALLGEGIKVKGDYRFSPFKDGSFDATLIHATPMSSTMDALSEFRRVTKEDGLIIVVSESENGRKGFEAVCDCLGSGGPNSGGSDDVKAQRLLLHYKHGMRPMNPKRSHGLEKVVDLPPEMTKLDISPDYDKCDVVAYRNKPAKASQKRITDF